MQTKSALMLSALLAAGTAQAVPVYYDFQGQVTFSNNPAHAVGSTVRYVFMVDRDLAGSRYHPSGNHVYADYPGLYDFFRVDYVGGDAMGPNPALYPYDWHVGGDQATGGQFAWLNGSNGYGSSVAVRGDGFLGTWTASTALSGFDCNGTYSVSSSLNLVGRFDFDPLTAPAVPEPETLALMGLGLAALGFAARRRKA